jgi:hypothetical protein
MEGKYSGLEVSDAKRPKALAEENAKLKEAADRGDARQRDAEGYRVKKVDVRCQARSKRYELPRPPGGYDWVLKRVGIQY